MATKTQLYSDLPIPPGDTLAEELAARGLSQAALARRMGRPLQTVNMIVTGKKRITAETALDLERVLAIPAHVWLGLQAEYDETRARLARQTAPRVARPRAVGLPHRVHTSLSAKKMDDLKKAKKR